MTSTLIVVSTFGVGLIYASFFEWWLHKYILHNPRTFFFAQRWFRDHTRVHHMKFKFDESYHLQHQDDEHIIDMKKWALLITAVAAIPFFLATLLLFGFGFEGAWLVAVTGCAVSGLYYLAYEYLHWCMHQPRERRIEMSWVFQRLNGHHLLHHRYMGKNFNVVFPLADLCLRTLLVRSKVSFNQPSGPAVPNVQPLS